ncbi:MAG: hypothetical protein IPH35_27255 [Rhodoferax sp.]|nr:hypothetical protein [Rhodoferax sp.]
MVLDEPSSSLDEAGDIAVLRAIAQFKAMGTTFVVITHRTHVLQVADKMLILRDGTVQAFGPTKDVIAALNKAAQQANAAATTAPAPAAAPSATPLIAQAQA